MIGKNLTRSNVFDILNYSFLALLAFTTLYPFWYTFILSISTRDAVALGGVGLIPKGISFISYKMVFNTPDILRAYGNTIFRSTVGTVLTLIFCFMTAYPLSKKRLPFRSFFNLTVLFTILFSGGIIPTYWLMKNLKLLDNPWVLILPLIISPWYIYFIRNYLQSLPESLEESAMMDGANHYTVLFKIMLPLSMPIFATIALWSAVNHWNSWFDALIYIDNPKWVVLQQLLQRIVVFNNIDVVKSGLVNPNITQFTPETIRAATITAVLLPILIVYPFLQKYFIKGLMAGSLKG